MKQLLPERIMCKKCAFLALVIVTELIYVTALPDEKLDSSRKLLQYPPPVSDQNRIGTWCSKDDIVINQGSTPPLPTGVPSYSVQVLNSGVSGCTISDIHVTCGWFSSDRMVNPLVFRRLDYDDCLVNDGEGLGPGEALSFQYASSFPYPMSVSSVACS